jgi:hypothetical protein
MREKRVPFSKDARAVQIIHHRYIIEGLLHDHTINRRRSLNYFYYTKTTLSLNLSLTT